MNLRLIEAFIGMIVFMPRCSAVETADPKPYEIALGSAVFLSPTNIAGVEVKGKSGSLYGHVEIVRGQDSLLIRNIDALLPVKSLATGMKVRDEHMRKYIFTTEDGKEPDLRFQSEKVTCPVTPSARDFSCTVAGHLSIRGISRAYNMTLRVKDQSGSLESWRATGDGVVKLSDYGITRPSQFGVTSADDVKLHLEFAGKQMAPVISTAEVNLR